MIEPTFQAVEPFSESLAITSTDRGTFFIDTRGNTVIPWPFQESAPFVHGLAAVLLPSNRVA